jgi:hypothetical protein
MADRTEIPDGAGTRWKRRWIAVTDWLGAQKPLNLILGAVIVIEGISLLAHLS